ncbi:MAG: helix-turn-helix domain-containing protein, partial [Enterococcus sp.]|nr:helix-turn-helix domain-containing protein [Enterococcus sp.]
MQANDLLMEDDRYKWYLLQYLELNKTAYSSVEQIGDLLEISRYKVEKYIQELQIELKEVTDETLIEIQDTGKITVQRLNHAIVKKMRLLLIERSISYQIFHRYVTKETSLDKQIEELHLSRSSTYRLYKKLKEQLADEGFQLKKNQLSGSELKIRSFLFGIYYEIFNGLANPFDEEIQQQSKELFRYLIHHLNLSIPKTKEHKLIYFISIALLIKRK